MRKIALATLALAALVLSACGNAVANPAPPATVVAVNPPDDAIKSAVTFYLSRDGNGKVSQDRVTVDKVEGNAARALVAPEDLNNGEIALVFLKLDAGLWQVVAGPGTAFTPEELTAAGIPESLLPTP